MPLYEDLVRRALEARGQRESARQDARRFTVLSQTLRDARQGRAMLVRCAWCDAFQIGEEWLHLEALNRGQRLITAAVRARASHGICPTCFEEQLTL